MAHDLSKTRICPWWIGYFLISPLRRLLQNPEAILIPHVKEGMTVLEVGPGMGFFSLSLARLVGRKGSVICVDVQERMLDKLKKRAEKAGLADRIATILASENSLHLDDYGGKVDFSLAFAVAHEVPDQKGLFGQINRAMKHEGVLLLSEPKGHVSDEEFEVTLGHATANGFEVENSVDVKYSLSRILKKVSEVAP